MKTHIARTLILAGTLSAMVSAIACSSNSKPTAQSSQHVDGVLRPAALRTVEPIKEPVSVATEKASAVKSPGKLMTYKSRDYGVSFLYPWQYSFVSAKAIANSEESLRPKLDGSDDQISLVRIEIPKGFYPDTNFENGYFVLSLNQQLSQEECVAKLVVPKDGKVQTDTINGVEYRWLETDSGGRGASSKVRDYVNFTNDTCYEVELGVTTRNEDGLAREVDADQVLRRLDAILTTVKITPSLQTPKVESSAKIQPEVPQN